MAQSEGQAYIPPHRRASPPAPSKDPSPTGSTSSAAASIESKDSGYASKGQASERATTAASKRSHTPPSPSPSPSSSRPAKRPQLSAASWRPSQPPPPPPHAPAPAPAPSQQKSKGFQTAPRPKVPLSFKTLKEGSIVWVPKGADMDAKSIFHQDAKGSNPYEHPAVVHKIDTATNQVHVYLLTSFFSKAKKAGAKDNCTPLTIQYPGSSYGVRRAHLRYIFIDHPDNATEGWAWTHPDRRVPLLQMDNNMNMDRPCYVNVQTSYRIEPKNLRWNRIKGGEQPTMAIDSYSVKAMNNWARLYPTL